MQSTQGIASQLDQINCEINPESCLHQTGWYQDRDNSMTPVSTNEGVGAAMAIVFIWSLSWKIKLFKFALVYI